MFLCFHDYRPVVLWVVLLVVMAAQKCAGMICFSCVCLFINNSVAPKDAGSVNGISMTFTAIGRLA